ncbi:hypothetical protein Ddye_030199 [Dipteronia dyeriana]|uniref:DUF659 domain-containing protein n=1 Tax=Dipteronia dyeriana TaxID=168575 RepID=A0AAD9TG17_9ROSI|nr:hypothetical protein Ddye_030199 [Dipteronia dyeriana]
MSTLDASQTSNLKKDPAWRYFSCPNPNDTNTIKCNFYGDDDLQMLFSTQKQPSGTGTGTGTGSTNESINLLKKPKQEGTLDLFYNKTPSSSRQSKLGESNTVKEELRGRVYKNFARWMYVAGIPFNTVRYRSFNAFCEAIGQYGPGVKPPTYHEVGVPLLKNEVKATRETLKMNVEEWKTFGCSILLDGWKDRREKDID